MDDGAIAVQVGITKVPESWLIDPDGYVRARLIGAITADTLDQQLATLSQQAEPPNDHEQPTHPDTAAALDDATDHP